MKGADITEPTYSLDDLPASIRVKVTIHPVSGCWIVPATKNGYAKLCVNGDRDWGHRLVYRLLVGPIPPRYDIDHVKARGCISRACINPAHLEAVTRKENLRRGTHYQADKSKCPRDHDLVPGNLVKSRLPHRICLTCQRNAIRRANRRARAPQKTIRAQRLANRSAEVTRLRASGLSWGEIGLRLGISKRTVGRILNASPGRPETSRPGALV